MQPHATLTELATLTEEIFGNEADLKSAAKPRGRLILRLLVWFSAAYFSGALVTDLVYWQMPNVMWERFSIWLIVAGLILAGIAVIAYVIDLASSRQIDRPAWPGVVGYALAVSALADKCLRSQPRRLHRRGTDRPDAFRARCCRSLADGPDWHGLGKSLSRWRLKYDARAQNCRFDEATASRRSAFRRRRPGARRL